MSGKSVSHINKDIFKSWTGKYPCSKTLRFELKPLLETHRLLDRFIQSDIQRAQDYKELKGIVDEYHKEYITKSLSKPAILQVEDIKKMDRLYGEIKKLKEYKEKEKLKKEISRLQFQLRKQITESFKNVQDLFGKKLLKERLPEWLENTDPEDKERKTEVIKKFQKFSTYLKGFNKNRKNIYSDKEQSTAISHRIINENLPKFLSNKQIYEKSDNFSGLRKKLNSVKNGLSEEFSYFRIKDVEEMFKPEFFNKCLSQKGIDCYNAVIGGKALEGGQKTQGLNEVVNEYRQDTQAEQGCFPHFQPLYKQILSDRETRSFLPEVFENRRELAKAVDEFWKSVSEPQENKSKKTDSLNEIKALFTDLSEDQNDMNKIYFERRRLSDVSLYMFEDWRFIQNALEYYIENKLDQKEDVDSTGKNENKTIKKPLKSVIEKEKKQFLEKDFFSFQEIQEALVCYRKILDDEKIKEKIKTDQNNLLRYFQNVCSGKPLLKTQNKTDGEKSEEAILLDFLENREMPDSELLKKFYDLRISKILKTDSENNSFSEDETKSLKVFLDSLRSFLWIIRPVQLEKSRKKVELDKDTFFYNRFDEFYSALSPIIDLYNKCRNFISENKNRLKKIKINFENSSLLDGWDVNKEKDNLSIILRKKQKGRWIYYLGVMDKAHKNIFDYNMNFKDHESTGSTRQKQELRKKLLVLKNDIQESETGYYEKMNYRQISDAGKDIHTLIEKDGEVLRKTKNLDELKRRHFPSPIFEIKKGGSYLKDSEKDRDGQNESKKPFEKKDLIQFIDYCKNLAERYRSWKDFKLAFRPGEKYKNFKDFTDHINSQGYKLSFDKVRSDYIEGKVRSGALYLFKIYNKDFSEHSKGNPNLHTTYFRMLFDEENLRDIVFKMSGEAEIFYRKASLKKAIIHEKNKPVKNKNLLNPRKTSTFKYDIIKDKRFTEDKFFFHLPVTLNFKAKSRKGSGFNQEVLSFLKDNRNINIIGIDRGERHLAYWTVINQNGDILEQGSFNTIANSYKSKGDNLNSTSNHADSRKQNNFLKNTAPQSEIEIKTNYHELLEKKERERDEARKSWTAVKNIKNLKAGYLSHLVHKISQLMIKYNAVVVLEDLNLGFKQGRMKFEKQVYQKLEKAVIDKLNYLVFKDRENLRAPGGYLNGYQLTAPFDSFQKIGRQTGFVFYVPASYTSKADPKTGFVNLIYPKYKSVKESKDFFKRFDKIFFDPQKDFFVFKYQDGKVNLSRKTESGAVWTVCTQGDGRCIYNWRSREHKKVNVTQKLKELFKKYQIDFESGSQDLRPEILQKDEKDFFSSMIYFLKMVLQLRYVNPSAKSDREKDFILSPVSDSEGRFFDSRRATDQEPQNADANGAYHIALKGLKSLRDLSSQTDDGLLQIKPLKNREWFEFIQTEHFHKSKRTG